MPSRKRLLFFLLIGFLTVAIGFIPDLVSEDLRPWCLQHFGPSYPWYLIGLFVVGCFVLLASSEFKDLLSLNQKAKTLEQIKISWSQGTKQQVLLARETIKAAQPEEAIKILSGLKNAVVDEQLSLLSVRLVKYNQESRLGILTQEQQDTAFHRIIKDILDLIKAIDTQLAEGEKENQQLRDAFRQRYRDRLTQKLASRQPVNLRRFATTEGTSEPVADTFIPYGSGEIGAEISKTFQDAYGRLLIVGQPGAGKTTLLLQLADRLFDLEVDALPVVLNLATWQSPFGKLETWLEMVLAAELSTNKAGAKAVLRQSNLILLLDGLDELKEDDAINSCLAAIADYGVVAGRRFVITCRIEEYKRVQEDARVNLQIEVGPLQGHQLEAELTRMGREQPEALPLLQAIQKDPLLRQAVETPFYFNTLQLLFAGRLPVFSAPDLESRKVEILQKFVESAFGASHNKTYPPDSAGHWLSFLASRMNQRNKVVFELRDLQYSWWQQWSLWKIIVFNFLYGLVVGPVVGLFLWLLGGLLGGLEGRLVEGLAVGLGVGLAMWLVVGLVGGLVLGLKSRLPYIETHDSVKWSMKALVRAVKNNQVGGLVMGLVFGLVFGLDRGLVFGLLGGLFFGLVFGLFFGLVDMFIYDFTYLIQISSPYHRFNASMKVFYFSILQHWHLRHLLYKKGALPLDLVDFLKEMSARNLLETDGATWRFRHRIIQEYFAERWVEPGANGEEKPTTQDKKAL